LISGRNIPFYESEETIQAQWLSGLAWYKKDIFREFKFEEKFDKWSFVEDAMLSHQIYRKYPGSLFYYPKAELYHYESPENRLDSEEMIYMKVLYRFRFFHKCVKGSYLFYWWGNLGEIFLHFVNALIGREAFRNSWFYLKANLKLVATLPE